MAGRIVLFGATGYTGRLTAEALVRRGTRPVLAARNPASLEKLASELGGLERAVADVARPETVRELVDRGDVLLTTVGPFKQWGAAAAEAAINQGAHYLDSTGEPPFIREVFEHYGPAAERAGIGMVTAFGYDWVPGNLAGALALRDAGLDAERVDVGYYFTGNTRGGMSGGTRASLIGVIAEQSFAFRDGRIVTEPGARRIRDFEVDGKRQPAVSVGASENFTLPRLAPQLREVNTYLGWFGPLSRPMQGVSLVGVGALQGTGGGLALRDGHEPLREGLDRRPRRAGAREEPLARRRRRLRRPRQPALGGPPLRREWIRLHRPRSSPGGPSERPRVGCSGRAPSDRWTASAWAGCGPRQSGPVSGWSRGAGFGAGVRSRKTAKPGWVGDGVLLPSRASAKRKHSCWAQSDRGHSDLLGISH